MCVEYDSYDSGARIDLRPLKAFKHRGSALAFSGNGSIKGIVATATSDPFSNSIAAARGASRLHAPRRQT
jgi:hypothetical protein